MTQPFLVYEHWVNDQCIYVGSGTSYRPYVYKSNNKRWSALFTIEEWKVLKFDIVKIVKTFDDRDEAYEYEKQLTIKRREEGHDILSKFNGRSNPGDANGFWGKAHTKESIEKAREKHLVNNKGKGNPMYGKRAALSKWTYLYKDGVLIKEFSSFKKCYIWIKDNIKGYPLKSLHTMKKTGEEYKAFHSRYKKFNGYKIICSKERLYNE